MVNQAVPSMKIATRVCEKRSRVVKYQVVTKESKTQWLTLLTLRKTHADTITEYEMKFLELHRKREADRNIEWTFAQDKFILLTYLLHTPFTLTKHGNMRVRRGGWKAIFSKGKSINMWSAQSKRRAAASIQRIKDRVQILVYRWYKPKPKPKTAQNSRNYRQNTTVVRTVSAVRIATQSPTPGCIPSNVIQELELHKKRISQVSTLVNKCNKRLGTMLQCNVVQKNSYSMEYHRILKQKVSLLSTYCSLSNYHLRNYRKELYLYQAHHAHVSEVEKRSMLQSLKSEQISIRVRIQDLWQCCIKVLSSSSLFVNLNQKQVQYN